VAAELIAALALATTAWLSLVCVRARRETKPAEPDVGQVIRLAGGDLQVRTDGPEDAAPVVLLHGFGGSLLWWEPAAHILAASFHVVRLDLLGHGGSERHSGDYSTPALARQVALALERIGVERAVVVGQSMGGLVGILVAEMRPELVRSLVLIDTPLEHHYQRLNFIGRLAFAPVVGPALRALASDRTLRRGLEVVFAEGFHVPDHLVHDARRMTWRAFKQSDDGQDRLLRGVPSPRDRVAALPVPVRVLWGHDDRLWPLAASGTYAGLDNVEVIEIPDTGHTPMFESPELVASLILEFASEESQAAQVVSA
jgi:pimeloyl-ACP methyl ester carboxylesterase